MPNQLFLTILRVFYLFFFYSGALLLIPKEPTYPKSKVRDSSLKFKDRIESWVFSLPKDHLITKFTQSFESLTFIIIILTRHEKLPDEYCGAAAGRQPKGEEGEREAQQRLQLLEVAVAGHLSILVLLLKFSWRRGGEKLEGNND